MVLYYNKDSLYYNILQDLFEALKVGMYLHEEENSKITCKIMNKANWIIIHFCLMMMPVYQFLKLTYIMNLLKIFETVFISSTVQQMT